MWSKKGVNDFLEANPIHTNGAIKRYIPFRQEIDDGDSYTVVEFPCWSNNRTMMRCLVKMLNNLLSYPDNIWNIYIGKSRIAVHFYYSVCDPD